MEYRVVDKQGFCSTWKVEADAHEYVSNRIERGYADAGDERVESREISEWEKIDPPEPTERDMIVYWFSGFAARDNLRDDLTALLPRDSDKVTLTYEQLLDMLDTVRRNSRQR